MAGPEIPQYPCVCWWLAGKEALGSLQAPGIAGGLDHWSKRLFPTLGCHFCLANGRAPKLVPMFPAQAVFGELGFCFGPLWSLDPAANLGFRARLGALLQLPGSGEAGARLRERGARGPGSAHPVPDIPRARGHAATQPVCRQSNSSR